MHEDLRNVLQFSEHLRAMLSQGKKSRPVEDERSAVSRALVSADRVAELQNGDARYMDSILDDKGVGRSDSSATKSWLHMRDDCEILAGVWEPRGRVASVPTIVPFGEKSRRADFRREPAVGYIRYSRRQSKPCLKSRITLFHGVRHVDEHRAAKCATEDTGPLCVL